MHAKIVDLEESQETEAELTVESIGDKKKRSRKMSSYTDCNVDSIMALMGGTIFHFIVGVKIMWGNVAPYITSYLVQFDPEVTYHNTL